IMPSLFFFFASTRRHTITYRDWTSDVCSSALIFPLRHRARVPVGFGRHRPGGWAVSAKFDWAARSVTQEKNGKSETLKMPADAQDPLSLAYSFAFVPPKGREYDVTRADGRGLTPFRFIVVGNEKLATPAGEMQTLHI